MRVLTFDIEEWFHILDNKGTKSVSDWNNFDSRIRLGIDLIFDILEKTGSSATFFVVGWMAEKHPDIIKEIDERGFEIGSHTHLHQLAYEQNRTTFFNDIEKSIKTLEDCTGKKVTSFRAPGFSITENNKWAFEILMELGITKDSSVFPATRGHGGWPSYGVSSPSLIKFNGIELKEFPINTYNILGKSFVFTGGGYFRITPLEIIKLLTNKSDYIMSYFHPRDFDINQPVLNDLTLIRRFKSYVGIKNCKSKLEYWLSNYNFIDMSEADEKINWNNVPILSL